MCNPHQPRIQETATASVPALEAFAALVVPVSLWPYCSSPVSCTLIIGAPGAITALVRHDHGSVRPLVQPAHAAAQTAWASVAILPVQTQTEGPLAHDSHIQTELRGFDMLAINLADGASQTSPLSVEATQAAVRDQQRQRLQAPLPLKKAPARPPPVLRVVATAHGEPFARGPPALHN